MHETTLLALPGISSGTTSAFADHGLDDTAAWTPPGASGCVSAPASGVVKRTHATILFTDIVGFTRFAEELPPDATLDLLRRYHRRMADAVEANGGLPVQYVGDSVMALFIGDAAGSRALNAAFAMLLAIRAWNDKRRLRGRFPVRVGIGVHCGGVAVGTSGTAEHPQRLVAGDTVNVARKLEMITRKVAMPLLASHETVVAARRAGEDRRLDRLRDLGPRELPGRAGQLRIWGLAA